MTYYDLYRIFEQNYRQQQSSQMLLQSLQQENQSSNNITHERTTIKNDNSIIQITNREKNFLTASKAEAKNKSNHHQFVISYNFDNQDQSSGHTHTHNLLLGWDDEPTKIIRRKAPLSNNSKTPLRNRLIQYNKISNSQNKAKVRAHNQAYPSRTGSKFSKNHITAGTANDKTNVLPPTLSNHCSPTKKFTTHDTAKQYVSMNSSHHNSFVPISNWQKKQEKQNFEPEKKMKFQFLGEKGIDLNKLKGTKKQFRNGKTIPNKTKIKNKQADNIEVKKFSPVKLFNTKPQLFQTQSQKNPKEADDDIQCHGLETLKLIEELDKFENQHSYSNFTPLNQESFKNSRSVYQRQQSESNEKGKLPKLVQNSKITNNSEAEHQLSVNKQRHIDQNKKSNHKSEYHKNQKDYRSPTRFDQKKKANQSATLSRKKSQNEDNKKCKELKKRQESDKDTMKMNQLISDINEGDGNKNNSTNVQSFQNKKIAKKDEKKEKISQSENNRQKAEKLYPKIRQKTNTMQNNKQMLRPKNFRKSQTQRTESINQQKYKSKEFSKNKRNDSKKTVGQSKADSSILNNIKNQNIKNEDIKKNEKSQIKAQKNRDFVMKQKQKNRKDETSYEEQQSFNTYRPEMYEQKLNNDSCRKKQRVFSHDKNSQNSQSYRKLSHQSQNNNKHIKNISQQQQSQQKRKSLENNRKQSKSQKQSCKEDLSINKSNSQICSTKNRLIKQKVRKSDCNKKQGHKSSENNNNKQSIQHKEKNKNKINKELKNTNKIQKSIQDQQKQQVLKNIQSNKQIKTSKNKQNSQEVCNSNLAVGQQIQKKQESRRQITNQFDKNQHSQNTHISAKPYNQSIKESINKIQQKHRQRDQQNIQNIKETENNDKNLKNEKQKQKSQQCENKNPTKNKLREINEKKRQENQLSSKQKNDSQIDTGIKNKKAQQQFQCQQKSQCREQIKKQILEKPKIFKQQNEKQNIKNLPDKANIQQSKKKQPALEKEFDQLNKYNNIPKDKGFVNDKIQKNSQEIKNINKQGTQDDIKDENKQKTISKGNLQNLVRQNEQCMNRADLQNLGTIFGKQNIKSNEKKNEGKVEIQRKNMNGSNSLRSENFLKEQEKQSKFTKQPKQNRESDKKLIKKQKINKKQVQAQKKLGKQGHEDSQRKSKILNQNKEKKINNIDKSKKTNSKQKYEKDSKNNENYNVTLQKNDGKSLRNSESNGGNTSNRRTSQTPSMLTCRVKQEFENADIFNKKSYYNHSSDSENSEEEEQYLIQKEQKDKIKEKIISLQNKDIKKIKPGQMGNRLSTKCRDQNQANLSLYPIRQEQAMDNIGMQNLNQTQMIGLSPKLQRKLNKKNAEHILNENIQDRQFYERAPILSFIYGAQLKALQQKKESILDSGDFEPSTQATSLQQLYCNSINIPEIWNKYWNSQSNMDTFKKAICFIVSINPWLIDRIIEPYISNQGMNQGWLYCRGRWVPFMDQQKTEVMKFIRNILKKAAVEIYSIKNGDLYLLGLEEIIRMITGLRVMQLRNKKKIYEQLSFNLKKGHIIKGIWDDPQQSTTYQILDVKKRAQTENKFSQLIHVEKQDLKNYQKNLYQYSNKNDNEDHTVYSSLNVGKDRENDTFWIKEELLYKYFDYFLLVTYRENSYWASESLKKQDNHTSVYTIDSLSDIQGSLEVNTSSQATCKIQFYREIKPHVLKFVGKIVQKNKNKGIRNIHNPNPNVYFDFKVRGKYYIFIQYVKLEDNTENQALISFESSQPLMINFLELVKNRSLKNQTSEYVQVNQNKTSRHTEGQKKKIMDINIRQQFIDYLLKEKNEH